MLEGIAILVTVVFFAFIVIFIILFTKGIAQAVTHPGRRRTAQKGYEVSLSALKRDPRNPKLQREALALGLRYAEVSREYDTSSAAVVAETAIRNEVHLASAAGPAQEPAPPAPSSPEQRLETLESLRLRGLITDAEYQSRREKILDEI